MFLEISQNSQKNKITSWLKSHTREIVCVSWLTNFCEGVCLLKSWLVLDLLVLFYDIKKFTKVLWDRCRLRLHNTLPLHTVHLWNPNLKTCFCVVFITLLLGNVFSEYYFPEFVHQNLIWLDCFWFVNWET